MQATVEDLGAALQAKKKSLYPSRQRFTLPLKDGEKKGTVLAQGKKLSDYGLSNGSILHFKDLGPQVRSLKSLQTAMEHCQEADRAIQAARSR